MAAKADAHSTAQARRRIAIDALGRELDKNPTSSSSRLKTMLGDARPMVVSADIDGLVSAAMLASVAPGFEIVAFSVQSARWLVHPSVKDGLPANAFGVDFFSLQWVPQESHPIIMGRA